MMPPAFCAAESGTPSADTQRQGAVSPERCALWHPVFLLQAGALEQERRDRARDARGFHEELEGLLDKVCVPLPGAARCVLRCD